MAAPKYYEGQEFISDDPKKPTLVYRGGKFFPKNEEPGGDPAGADAPFAPLTPGSDSRARITLGLGPSVNAQRNIYASEGWAPDAKGQRHPKNPYNKDWGAKMLDGVDIPIPFTGGQSGQSATFSPFDTLAKVVGGQDYQDYEQANKSFESAFLPVLSGAAVTPTEAQRMIRANLPEMGDTPATLSRKATNRAMMINGAADLAGRPRPFPKVGTWDFKGEQPGSQPRAGSRNAEPVGSPVRVQSVEEAMKLPAGTVFITPDGRRKVR